MEHCRAQMKVVGGPLMRITRSGMVAPKKTIYLATEGANGTERFYIKHLCQKYGCALQPIPGLSPDEADPVKLVNAAIKFSKTGKKNTHQFEIWVMFDNDNHAKVVEAFNIVDKYNKRVSPRSLEINMALNSPLVEVWGLLCCGYDKKIPLSGDRCKSELKHIMPRYDHEHSKEFVYSVMDNGLKSALERAQHMELSAGECEQYDISPQAGIYKLVASIVDPNRVK